MNNKIIFYASPFPRIKSYKQMIDCAVEYGLSSVEGFCQFEFETPDINAALEIKEYADSKNIRFPCFSLLADLTGDNYKEEIERAKKYAEVASILGSPFLHHTITPESSDAEKVLTHKEKHFEKGILAVREIYDYAESFGVKLIFEDQGFIFNGVERFGEFLDKVDRNVGVVADFGNIYQSRNTIEEFITAFSNKICHVHIKDISITDSDIYGTGLPSVTGKFANEVQIGTGIVDFKKCFTMLKNAGYNGYYGLEYGAKSDDSDIIKVTLEQLTMWLK